VFGLCNKKISDGLFCPQVKRLVEMGFGDAQVRSAIESSGGDENLALEKLCSA